MIIHLLDYYDGSMTGYSIFRESVQKVVFIQRCSIKQLSLGH